MTAPSFFGPKLRTGLLKRMKVPTSLISASSTDIQLVPPPPKGYANVPTRLIVAYMPLGAAITGVGANDNLVLRYTNASGAVCTQAITGVGFLDSSSLGVPLVAAADVANVIFPPAGAPLELAYAASADGVTVTNSTGYLNVAVEYDIVFVG